MLACWNESPNQRLSFEQIRLEALTILETLVVSMLFYDLVAHWINRE